MYRADLWIDGWLWIKTTPNGEWRKASAETMIDAMRELLDAAAEGLEMVERQGMKVNPPTLSLIRQAVPAKRRSA